MTYQKNDSALSEITEVIFKNGMSGLDKVGSYKVIIMARLIAVCKRRDS